MHEGEEQEGSGRGKREAGREARAAEGRTIDIARLFSPLLFLPFANLCATRDVRIRSNNWGLMKRYIGNLIVAWFHLVVNFELLRAGGLNKTYQADGLIVCSGIVDTPRGKSLV